MSARRTQPFFYNTSKISLLWTLFFSISSFCCDKGERRGNFDQPTVEPKGLTPRPHLLAISRRELIMAASAGLVWALPNAGFIVLMGFMPAFLVSNGMEIAKAGMLVSLSSWITIGSIPLGGWFTDRTGRVNAFIIGGVLLNALFIFLMPLDVSVLFGGVLMILTVAALTTFRILQRRWPAEEAGQLLDSTT